MYCLCNCNGKERDKKIKKKKEITCFRCKKTGHYSNECEEELPKTNHEKKGTNQSINKEERSDEKWDQKTSTMKKDDYKGFAFIQDVACSWMLLDSCILLDSQSTVDVFMNKKLLKNIWDTKKTLSLHCNAGVTTVDKIRYLWDMAQHGSMKMVLPIYYHWTMWRRSIMWPIIVLHVIVLKCTKQMVPNMYLSLQRKGYSTQVWTMTTVEDKTNKYTVKEYLNAKYAYELQNIIGRPSTQD